MRLLARLTDLREEMRRYKAQKLSGCDDLGLLPKHWKMSRVSSHQVVGSGSIGTFKEYVVARVARDLKASCRRNGTSAFYDEL
jgi:hypothetical protein